MLVRLEALPGERRAEPARGRLDYDRLLPTLTRPRSAQRAGRTRRRAAAASASAGAQQCRRGCARHAEIERSTAAHASAARRARLPAAVRADRARQRRRAARGLLARSSWCSRRTASPSSPPTRPDRDAVRRHRREPVPRAPRGGARAGADRVARARSIPTRPACASRAPASSSEAGELALAFNEMLERLEHERAQSARSVLAAHESERLRVAQELHDEVGQTLTAVLLQLSRAAGSSRRGAAASSSPTRRRRCARASRTCGGSPASCVPRRSPTSGSRAR